MNQDFIINENKINNILDEVERDRNKIFNDIKTTQDHNEIKNIKLKALESIQKSLLNYKKILVKEKKKNED
jgi:hypothetical protein